MSQIKEDIEPRLPRSETQSHSTLSADHSPTPWAYQKEIAGYRWLEDAKGETIFHIDEESDWPDDADAEFILQACNEYEALKAVVSNPHKWMRWCDIRVLEASESLAEENARLKQHVSDLEHDMKASELHCEKYHAEVG